MPRRASVESTLVRGDQGDASESPRRMELGSLAPVALHRRLGDALCLRPLPRNTSRPDSWTRLNGSSPPGPDFARMSSRVIAIARSRSSVRRAIPNALPLAPSCSHERPVRRDQPRPRSIWSSRVGRTSPSSAYGPQEEPLARRSGSTGRRCGSSNGWPPRPGQAALEVELHDHERDPGEHTGAEERHHPQPPGVPAAPARGVGDTPVVVAEQRADAERLRSGRTGRRLGEGRLEDRVRLDHLERSTNRHSAASRARVEAPLREVAGVTVAASRYRAAASRVAPRPRARSAD